MRPHTVRVYALDIVYPEGSFEPGWYPPRWDEPEFLAALTRRQRRELPKMKRQFRWPHERLFLASSGARGRALLLRAYGAQVEVLGSDPVTWRVHLSPQPLLWPFAEPAEGLTSPMAAAEEEARQEAAREWMREHAHMYLSDTASAAAETARFRR